MLPIDLNPTSYQPYFVSLLQDTEGYQLLDSGNGRKLERFGRVLVDRPEPQAMWVPRFPDAWKKADGVFSGEEDADQGRWKTLDMMLQSWPMPVLNVTALCKFSAFRHLGVFIEQLPHWQWMLERLKPEKKLLNLFGYTGVASLLAGQMGAEVTHVDASKKAIEWAKQNQAASQLEKTKIRWIVEDARKFVAREVRRGKVYDGILIDPPKFGRGPEGEVWDIFNDLPPLLKECGQLLAPNGFIILTSYAIRASFLSFDCVLKEILQDRGGIFSSGEVAVQESGEGRILSAANFSRWNGS